MVTVRMNLGEESTNAFVFSPAEVTFEAGRLTNLVLKNPSAAEHYFSAPEFSAKVYSVLVSVNGVEVKGPVTELALEPGAELSWVFGAPCCARNFQSACLTPGCAILLQCPSAPAPTSSCAPSPVTLKRGWWARSKLFRRNELRSGSEDIGAYVSCSYDTKLLVLSTSCADSFILNESRRLRIGGEQRYEPRIGAVEGARDAQWRHAVAPLHVRRGTSVQERLHAIGAAWMEERVRAPLWLRCIGAGDRRSRDDAP